MKGKYVVLEGHIPVIYSLYISMNDNNEEMKIYECRQNFSE